MDRINEILVELNQPYPDIRYLNGIKSGKEADVHLIATNTENYALKIYKPDLKFRSRKEYFMMSEIKEKRQGRAIRNNSRFGKQLVLSIWAEREYSALKKLYNNGASVPKPYRVGGDYVLQEFIGQNHIPAPQLIKATLNQSDAELAFDTVCNTIATMWALGYVHGDLSPYNILWNAGQTVVIDFPQVVMNANNPEAPAKLLRDIENIANFFKKYDLDFMDERTLELSELAYQYFG